MLKSKILRKITHPTDFSPQSANQPVMLGRAKYILISGKNQSMESAFRIVVVIAETACGGALVFLRQRKTS